MIDYKYTPKKDIVITTTELNLRKTPNTEKARILYGKRY